MRRRILLKAMGALPLMVALARRGVAAQGEGSVNVEELQRSWKGFLADGADVALTAEPIKHSQAEWRKLLTPQQYNVLRDEGTEQPIERGKKRRRLRLCRLPTPAFHFGHEIRKQYRLAELFHDHTRRARY
jgi:hypothetical protein